MSMKQLKFAYRVVAKTCANTDQFDEYCGSNIHVYFQKFEIVKWTPQGIWIKQFMGQPKFVLLTAFKKFASPSKQEAIDELVRRKTIYTNILNEKIHQSQIYIKYAKNLRR